jgi:predicted GNAT family acetyltransferase
MFGEVKRVADKFLIRLGPGKYAYLNYRLEGGTMYIDATFTPEEHRGLGLAAKLTKAAIEYARENALKIVPNCSYVRDYFEKHPEYRDILAGP